MSTRKYRPRAMAYCRPRPPGQIDVGRVTALRAIRDLSVPPEIKEILFKIYTEVTESGDLKIADIGKKLDLALKRVAQLEYEVFKLTEK